MPAMNHSAQVEFRSNYIQQSCFYNCSVIKNVDSPFATWEAQMFGYFVNWKAMALAASGELPRTHISISNLWNEELIGLASSSMGVIPARNVLIK